MLGIHTFWTKPFQARRNKSIDEDIVLSGVEFLTWMVSAKSWKNTNGPIHLYTDSRGLKFIQRNKIEWVWDKIETCLDDVPYLNGSNDNAQCFWAANKIYALQICKEMPCAIIDMDAVVWKNLDHITADISVLHNDDPYWPCYAFNRRDYSSFISEEFNTDIIWKKSPWNTSIMLFRNLELKDLYVKTATKFLDDYDKMGDKTISWSRIVFAEQRLLPMCSEYLKCTEHKFSELEFMHAASSPYISHLWNAKSIYTKYNVAYVRYCRWMISFLMKNDIRFAPIITKISWELDKIETSWKERLRCKFQRWHLRKYGTQIKNLKGTALIWEPHLPEPRIAYNNEILFAWENIQLLTGQFDLYKSGKLFKQFRVASK